MTMKFVETIVAEQPQHWSPSAYYMGLGGDPPPSGRRGHGLSCFGMSLFSTVLHGSTIDLIANTNAQAQTVE